MYKRFSIIGIVFSFASNHALANDTDWRVFSAWCPDSLSVCTSFKPNEVVRLGDVIDTSYQHLAPPSEDDASIFTTLKPIYQALSQGEDVERLEQYIQLLEADKLARQSLYDYMVGKAHTAPSLERKELRHYHKEWGYLSSLQQINQEQQALLETLPFSQHDELKKQLYGQGQALAKAKSFITKQLEDDIERETLLLEFFLLRQGSHE